MKPTYFSHDAPRLRLLDQAGSWSYVENMRLQLEDADVCQVGRRPAKNAQPGLCGPDVAETDYCEVFQDPCKFESVAPWTFWKDSGSSRSLLRSRSHIRTNPWMCSNGESPPRSSADVHLGRHWSAVETGISSSPLDPQTTLENEATMTSRLYLRNDSLLTTSVESDSLYHSLTSDTDTATSLMSVSDVTMPEVYKDGRSRDFISGGSSKENQADRSSLTPKVRYDWGQDRGEPAGYNLDFENYDTFLNRSKEIKTCGRTWSSGQSCNLQLRRPSFGGRRFSDIADDYEAKTAKWLNSEESGITTQPSHTRSIDTSVEKDIDFVGHLSPRSSTTMEQDTLIDREGFDIPTYETPFSTSLQFRKKMLAVRSSLQDKVSMLRREKRVVDEKIREAKEEERIRLLQLDKFRRQLSSTRKEILLRTLDELRRSLNDQSLKLQKLYDIVLLEQRQILCCH